MSSQIKSQILSAVKDAMRARESVRLGTLRMITADIKQIEIDKRIEMDDTQICELLSKLVKQRQESKKQYIAAEREDLAAQEATEIEIISTFLPESMDDAEIATLVDQAVDEVGASSMRDMGKVMGILKPKMVGRADMGGVSQLVKAKLNN